MDLWVWGRKPNKKDQQQNFVNGGTNVENGGMAKVKNCWGKSSFTGHIDGPKMGGKGKLGRA